MLLQDHDADKTYVQRRFSGDFFAGPRLQSVLDGSLLVAQPRAGLVWFTLNKGESLPCLRSLCSRSTDVEFTCRARCDCFGLLIAVALIYIQATYAAGLPRLLDVRNRNSRCRCSFAFGFRTEMLDDETMDMLMKSLHTIKKIE